MREERVRTVIEGADPEPPLRTLYAGVALGDHRWERFGPGASVEPPDQRFERVVLRLPKGRRNLRATLHLLAARLEDDGALWLCGPNDEGIKSADSTLKELFEQVETLDTRRKCRLWEARTLRAEPQPLASFETAVEAHVGGRALNFVTLPGVFAEGRLDEGTRLLLENLGTIEGSVLDFGCGAGVIGVFLGRPVDGIDIDAWAVHCAVRNGEQAQLSDGWSAVDKTYDVIVSNPPFHAGKDTDFRVMEGLLEGAKARLNKGGSLVFVCPATTPVERTLKQHFKVAEAVATDRRYTVWRAR